MSTCLHVIGCIAVQRRSGSLSHQSSVNCLRSSNMPPTQLQHAFMMAVGFSEVWRGRG